VITGAINTDYRYTQLNIWITSVTLWLACALSITHIFATPEAVKLKRNYCPRQMTSSVKCWKRNAREKSLAAVTFILHKSLVSPIQSTIPSTGFIRAATKTSLWQFRCWNSGGKTSENRLWKSLRTTKEAQKGSSKWCTVPQALHEPQMSMSGKSS